MSATTFFPEHAAGRPGLALFLNAGDPPFAELERLVMLFDRSGVDVLELAVPFPNAVSDGPVNLRSSRRALAHGVDLNATLAFVAAVRPVLSHLKLVLLVDWRHTVRDLAMGSFLEDVRRVGCDALLLHGMPPMLRPSYYEQAALVGQPVVTSCYLDSGERVVEEACAHETAFVYLMARYGRSGGRAVAPQPSRLAARIAALRAGGAQQVAVGFGIKSGADVRAVCAAGADGAIVGSACVACVEAAMLAGDHLLERMARLIGSLHGRPIDGAASGARHATSAGV